MCASFRKIDLQFICLSSDDQIPMYIVPCTRSVFIYTMQIWGMIFGYSYGLIVRKIVPN